MTDRPPVAIIGAGLIGQSWAICFSRTGHAVRLYDPAEGAGPSAIAAIARALGPLSADGLLHSQSAETVLARIRPVASLAEAVAEAIHVQENSPELIEVKRAVFAELDAITSAATVIASSTSALLPSSFTQGLRGAHRCLVAHPLNPPHLLPAVEIVPGPLTAVVTVKATVDLMRRIGQHPFVMRRELAGFVMNRLQGALLDEAMQLVSEGYIEVEDIDVAVRDGLARRWSLMGPFETMDLNAPDGVAGFFERYGAAYAEIGRQRPSRPLWSGDLAAKVIASRRAVLPARDLADRRAWRDRHLSLLAAHFRRTRD